MLDPRVPPVAPLAYREPLEYSMAPRTVPRFVRRFTNPRPPSLHGTTPHEAAIPPDPARHPSSTTRHER